MSEDATRYRGAEENYPGEQAALAKSFFAEPVLNFVFEA
jgi:hypothetical protein